MTKVWIVATSADEREVVFEGALPLRVVQYVASERQKLVDRQFQLIPEGGEPYMLRDILVLVKV